MRAPFLFAAFLLAPLFVVQVASAHIQLTSPPQRTTEQKNGPCGARGSVRLATVAVFRPGETITVTWDETINHTAHYRIAFDADGQDDLVDVAGRDDLYNSPAVLLDGIADNVGGSYSADVTLPAVECENCVLQLIQVMYGAGNYYQCSDIALRGDPMPPPVDAGPAPEMDAGPDVPDAGPTPGDADPPPVADAGATDGDAAVGPGPGPSPGAADMDGGDIRGGCSVAETHTGGQSAWIIGLACFAICLRRGRRVARGQIRR